MSERTVSFLRVFIASLVITGGLVGSVLLIYAFQKTWALLEFTGPVTVQDMVGEWRCDYGGHSTFGYLFRENHSFKSLQYDKNNIGYVNGIAEGQFSLENGKRLYLESPDHMLKSIYLMSSYTSFYIEEDNSCNKVLD